MTQSWISQIPQLLSQLCAIYLLIRINLLRCHLLLHIRQLSGCIPFKAFNTVILHNLSTMCHQPSDTVEWFGPMITCRRLNIAIVFTLSTTLSDRVIHCKYLFWRHLINILLDPLLAKLCQAGWWSALVHLLGVDLRSVLLVTLDKFIGSKLEITLLF